MERRMTPAELQDARARLGLTQPALAELLGVHPLTVSQWETERRAIPAFLHLALKQLEQERTPAQ